MLNLQGLIPLFFFFKTISLVPVLLPFHIHVGRGLFKSAKFLAMFGEESHESYILIWGRTAIFTMFGTSIPWTGIYLDDVCFLWFSTDTIVHKYFTLLSTFKYCEFNLISTYTLLVYRNVIFFCIVLLNSVTVMNSYIDSRNL